MKMVTTRAKKRTPKSNKRPEAKEPEPQISDSPRVDMVEPNEDSKLEDEVDLVTDKEENANYGEMSEEEEEGEKDTYRDNEDLGTPLTKSNNDDDKAESEENTSEDGEKDDQEDMLLFDDNEEHNELYNEERFIDEFELSDEEPLEEDDVDEVSGGEATEEDEVSSEEATMEEYDEENNQEGKDNGKPDRIDAKATGDGTKTKEHAIEESEASLKNFKKSSVQAGKLKKVEYEDKPESSSKRKLKSTEEDEVSEENNKEKENAKHVTRKAKVTEDGSKTKEHSIEKLEASLKDNKKPSEGSRKKKVQADKLKSEDKPESSQKRKVKKRIESMGMIFICNSETRKDCHQYRVFGLPESKIDVVEKIYTGMRLFLYDIDLKLMHGIYKAAGPGGFNIEPKAFKSQYPSQVRFKFMEKCTPLTEEQFKTVIKQNYFTRTKFDCQLNSEQVKKLCRLFSASKARPSKKLGRSLKAEKTRPIRQERDIRQRAGDKRLHLPSREEVRPHDRPRKRARQVISPPRQRARRVISPPPRQRIASPKADVYRRERRSPYRERRDRPLTPLGPPTPRDERYRDSREVEDRYPYRGGRDPRIDRHDPFAEEAETYSRRRERYMDATPLAYLDPVHDPYRVGQDPYLARRDVYRDRRDSYAESPYRDPRSSYLERRVSYADSAHPVLYGAYRRPLLSDSRDVYREERGIEIRDSYRRELPPLESETRSHHELASRDAYMSIRERLSYAEPIYSSAYPSRAGVYRL